MNLCLLILQRLPLATCRFEWAICSQLSAAPGRVMQQSLLTSKLRQLADKEPAMAQVEEWALYFSGCTSAITAQLVTLRT